MDDDLLVLPQLEFAVSSQLSYQQFRSKLQKIITHVYDCKDEMCDLDGSNADDRNRLIEMIEECGRTTSEAS